MSHDSRNVPGDRVYDEACREVDELTPSVPPMARPVAKGWPPVRANWYDAPVRAGLSYSPSSDTVHDGGRAITRKEWEMAVDAQLLRIHRVRGG